MATWREREAQAQLERVMPIWVNEPFWKEHASVHADHFVHLSQKNPPLLAYTASEEKGERDIQTPVKAGRYLTQYFSKVLTAKQIAFLAAWQAQGAKPKGDESEAELKFATTPDEICDVYARGPQSCMDAEAFRKKSEMPVRVYGAGDLAIAYFEGKGPPRKPEHTVLARCLVWPEKKVAGRVYPTPGNYARDGYVMFETSAGHYKAQEAHEAMHRAMVTKLKAEGYRFLTEGFSFNGAKLLKISERGDHVMPYLDNDYGVDDAGPHWVMTNDRPEYPAQDTNGLLEERQNDDEDAWTCERCDERMSGDEYSCTRWEINNAISYWQHQTWCEHCRDNHSFHCEGFNEDISEDHHPSIETSSGTYSVAYAERHFYRSDYSGDWFDPDDEEKVEMDDGSIWATSEFDRHGVIDETGAYVPAAETIRDENQKEIAL